MDKDFKKLQNEIKTLVKMGVPEDMAIIIASANMGKPELANSYLEELHDEQKEIQEALAGFVKFGSLQLEDEKQKEETKEQESEQDNSIKITITETTPTRSD